MKIIGKIFISIYIFLFYLITPIKVFCSPTLKITDLDGNYVQQATVGVPFILSLHIDRGANDNKQPEIQGLKSPDIFYEYQGTTSLMQSISGNVTVSRTFNYIVRIDKEGEYYLGPASLKIQGGEVESNKLKIKVLKVSPVNTSKKESFFLNLKVDKEIALVGQKIVLTITSQLPDDATVSTLTSPELKEFNIYKIMGPIKENDNNDNKEAESDKNIVNIKWIYEIFPKRAGKVVIPAILLNYQIEDKRNNFFSFFKSYITKQLVSNSVSLEIKPLPYHTTKLDGVGNFTKFVASVDKFSAKVGDGIIYKLELEGDGDLSSIDFESLEVPEGIKVFKSKSNSILANNKSDEKDKKVWEFILQGASEGEFVINSPALYIFDTNTNSYKILRAEPVTLNFTKEISFTENNNIDSQDIIVSPPVDHDANNNQDANIKLVNKFYKIIKELKLYLLISLLLIIAFIKIDFNKLKNSILNDYHLVYFKLLYAQKNGDAKYLQQIIMNFIEYHYNKPKNKLDYDFCVKLINDQKWANFLDNLFKLNFGYTYYVAKDKASIFKESFMFLKKLARCKLINHFLLLVVLFVSILMIKLYFVPKIECFYTQKETVLRTGPDNLYHECGNVPAGTKVDILKKVGNNWVLIKSETLKGWTNLR